HRRHLRDRARLLRTRLRDEARDRQRARRPHHRAPRELVPPRGAGAARPQGRSTEGAVPAENRRLGGGAREDSHRAMGPVRDAERPRHLPGAARGGHPARRHLRARPARRGRPGHAAEGADEPTRVRPARGGLRTRVQRADPDRGRHEGRPGSAAAHLRRRPGHEERRVRAPAAAERREDGRHRLRDADVGAAGPGDRRPRQTTQQDTANNYLVSRLRNGGVPAATENSQAVAYVSGQTAPFKDIGDRIMQRLPLFPLYIVGVTFIVLAMAFRSIVISLTAAITTILSAFIGFGVLTLVVQEGHLLGLTGLDRTGPIETFVPPIAFAILFGLSMDYMVFLMSRIREEHVHGLPTREAVEHGVAAIGRVIVAAA